ncbi:TPA: hypothetical protein ACIJO3_002400 [Klebsiella pneumoniae]
MNAIFRWRTCPCGKKLKHKKHLRYE